MRSFTIETCTSDKPIEVDADTVTVGLHFVTFNVADDPVLLVATHAIQTIRGTDPRTRPADAVPATA